MSEEQWEYLDEAPGDLQAEILKGFLEAQGIPVWLSQEGAGRAYGIGVGELGRVQILVPTHYLEQARAVMNDYYAGKFEASSTGIEKLESSSDESPENDESAEEAD